MRPSRLVLYLLLVLAKRLSASVRPSPATTPSLPLAAAMGHLSSVKSALVVHGVIPAVLEGKHADINGKTHFRNRTAVVSSKGELWPNRTVSSGKSAFWPNQTLSSGKSAFWPNQTLSSGKSASWSNRSVGSIKSPFWDSDPAFFPHPTLRKYADSVVPFYRVRSDLQKPPARTVTLLGLFELSTAEGDRPEGRSELAAALLAIKHVNQRKVLGDYQMRIITNDTKCDVGVGVDTYFHALYTQREMRMPALLGTGCSQVTESLAKITPYWNMVQVSFGSTSPALSDRREFPLFYRTAAPDSAHNPARLALVTRFGWETVTALSQNEDDYTLAVNDLVTQLEQANITCRATLTFAETDFNEQLNRLKAHRLGMYGPDYVWILHGSPGDQWWRGAQDGGCTPAKMAAAVEGLIIVSSHNTIIGDRPSVSGLRNDRFVTSLPLPRSQFVHQAYDAVWAVALAMRDSGLDLGRFEYADRAAARRLFHALANVSFFGISGPVSFNGADRVGVSAFHRVQGGKVVRVALYDPTTGALDFSCSGCSPIAWRQVPIAKRVFKLRVVTIRPVAFLVVASLATVGIALACTFLAFNLYFRRLKFIKLSSPRLNNMAVVGCILVYTAVILLGLDHATLPSHDAFPTVCTARVYLLSAGFSLAFGSMFTKTYRVHRIFTRSASGVVKNKLLQDTQLISLICALLVIDGLIVTLWVTVDPMQRQLRNLTLEISATDRSVVYQPQVEVCGSQFTHSWLGALYAYKGLLLIVGVYMAWETRHVKIPALNDSQYIGLSVYSVVITSALVVVLANLISERATLAFVTITSLIMGSTTASLCLLFLPKIHTILHSRDNAADPVTHSMGLKIECNTRRFLIDDHREVYYRVEVQNRVYRREIVALDNEITKLEKALSSDPSLASSSHSSVVSRKEEVPPATRGPLPPTSVGGTLPMLLLSVLPPVIPRASWPSAEHCLLNHGLTFSSEPHLEEMAVDAMEAGELGEGGEAKPSVLGRLLHMLGPSRKTSTVSMVAGGGGGGIAAALRVHVGYITGLVPSDQSRSGSLDSSSNNSRYCVKRSREELFSRRVSEDESRSAQSLQHGHNQRVSFSVTQQSSQPALRVRGSPRFPHRIVPTCSLDALEASGRQPAPVRAGKCRSLEDATVISAVEPSC